MPRSSRATSWQPKLFQFDPNHPLITTILTNIESCTSGADLLIQSGSLSEAQEYSKVGLLRGHGSYQCAVRTSLGAHYLACVGNSYTGPTYMQVSEEHFALQLCAP
jgi:hypothetical protein